MPFQLRLRISLPRATCPECLGTHVRRHYANRYVDGPNAWALLTFTLRSVFICQECDCRFWDFALKAPFRMRTRRSRDIEYESEIEMQ